MTTDAASVVAPPGNATGADRSTPHVVLRHVAIRDFRNLQRVEVELPPSGVVIVGANGHGKTNFLEAIHYFHALRSMRGARDADLVRFGADGFHLAAQVRGATVDEMRVGFQRSSARKKVVTDGAEQTRLADALGAVPSVLFAPRDVALVAGPPTERRRFLDIALATTTRRYLTALQEYRAALVRRNAALRTAARRGDMAAVAVWEPALARAGATLWCERWRWVNWAAAQFSALCAAIGEREPVMLAYHSSLDVGEPDAHDDESAVREALALALARGRDHDVRRLVTHSGPHRDDLTIRLGPRLLRTFGSAGQQRTAAIALRLLERLSLRERTGRSPLVLLDDPFAELDPERVQRILTLLTGETIGQTVLVVPRGDDVPPAFVALTRLTIADGVIHA